MGGILGGGKSSSQSYVAPMEASLRVSTSAYGLALPIVYGKTRVPANMIWYGAFTAVPHTTTSSSGGGKGGGGGGGSTSTTYTYTASMMLGLSEGAISAIGAVWKDKDYFQNNDLFTVFHGGEFQEAWPYMVSKFPDQALAYRGVAYVAAANYNLGDSSSTPNHSFEVSGILSSGETGYDVLPDEILRDFLGNLRYGAGFPFSKMADWTDYAQYAYTNNLRFSPAVDSARPAHEFVTQMMKLTNSGVYFSEGLLKITPYGDQTTTYNGVTYTPNLTPVYEFTDNDYIAEGGNDPITVERVAPADCYNQVQLEFVNRANQYNVEISEAKDQANITAFGLRPMESIQAHEIADASIARTCSQLMLQRSVYIRNRYEFTVGAKFCLLEPTDYVTITDTTLGLVDKPVRVLTIEERDDYTFRITAEDAPYGVSSSAEYPSQGSDGHTNEYNIVPSNTATPLVFNAPAQLTTSGLEVWMAAYGTDEYWGGCEVWASYDNTNYARIGVINAPARMGTLTASLPLGSDPDETNTLAVTIASHQALQSVSQTDADNKVTLSYVDGELVSYESATLTGSDAYDLTYLRRGCYGTPNSSHASGTVFCRLDDAILRMPFTPDKVGQTLYLKFPAYNIYGSGLQQLGDIDPITYTITASISRPDDVTGFVATYSYPNVFLKWTPPDATSNVRQFLIKRGVSWSTAATIAVVSGDSDNYTDTAQGIGSYTYWIAAVDDAGVQSNAPQYSVVTISQIAALTGLQVSAGFQSFFLQYVQPTDPATAGVMVWVSETSTFTPSSATLVYSGPDTLIVVNQDGAGMPLSSDTTYYVKAAAYSKLGTTGLNYSTSLAVTPMDVVVDIPDGSITTTKIADDAITTPKLTALAVTADKIAANSITAAKIVAGTITGDKLAANTITANKIDGRELLIKDAAGNVILGAGYTLDGSTYIADGSISNAKIGNTIQSNIYISGTYGWKIDKTGNIELNSAVFRGTLDVKSATTGARVEIKNNVIKVYDSLGALRVQIGDLTA